MEITVNRTIIRIATVIPEERIDAMSAPALREQLEALLDEGVTQFVLDLSEVPFIDSAGMSVMVSLLKRARQAGGDVKLVWPRQDAARRILHLTKFDRVFDMFDSAQVALKVLGV